MNDEKKQNTAKQGSARTLSVAMAAIMIVVILSVGLTQKGTREFGLGDYSGADIAGIEQRFQASGGDADLIELLKAMCYMAVVEGDESDAVTGAIEGYGTILLDRARAGRTDLQTLDDEAVMLELLEYIRGYGAN